MSVTWKTNALYYEEGTTLATKAYVNLTDDVTGAATDKVYAIDSSTASGYNAETCSDADVVAMVKTSLGPTAVANAEGAVTQKVRFF